MKATNVINLRTNRAERRRARSQAFVHACPASKPMAPRSDPSVDHEFLKQALMLNWLGQQPVAFHRCYVDITGSVLCALWLSHAMDKTADSPDANRVLEITTRECEEETGITRSQQATCRRRLIALGLLSQQSRRGNVVRYRIHSDHLAQCLMRQAQPLAATLRSNAEAFRFSDPPSRQHSV